MGLASSANLARTKSIGAGSVGDAEPNSPRYSRPCITTEG